MIKKRMAKHKKAGQIFFCALLLFLLPSLVYADNIDNAGGGAGENEALSVFEIDSFSSELLWTDAGGALDIHLTEHEKLGNVLAFSGDVNSENSENELGASASLLREYETPLDLYYYKTLKMSVFIDKIDNTAIEEKFTFELSFGALEQGAVKIESASRTFTAGEIENFVFDLNEFSRRDRISFIEMRVLSADVDSAIDSFNFKIGRISAEGRIDSSAAERFLCEDWTAAGGTEISIGKNSILLQNSGNDAAIEGNLRAKPVLDANAVRISLLNDTKATAVRIYYTFSENVSFTQEQSVSVNISRAVQMQYYTLPLENASDIKKIKIQFVGNSKGDITIYSVLRVSTFVDTDEKLGGITFCGLSDDGKYILIKGNVKGEHTSAYRDYTLALYELSAYEDVSVISERTTLPTSTHSMSTKFEFRLPLSSANRSSILSKYAVVLYKDGSVLQPLKLIDSPKYVSSAGNLAKAGESAASLGVFKGVQTSYLSGAQEIGAGRVIIDIDFDKLLSKKNNGYLHLAAGRYIYFDSAYVDNLDREIKAYTLSGVEVVLNLLSTQAQMPYTFTENHAGVKYYALNASGAEGALYIGAVVDFLSVRYNNTEGMGIGGFILGRRVDMSAEYNYMGADISAAVYAQNYLAALRLVYNTAQSRNNSLLVYASFSDAWTSHTIRQGEYDTELLIETISALLFANGGIDWRVMIHSYNNSLNLRDSDGTLQRTADFGYLGADSIELLTDYIKTISAKYNTANAAPASVLYFWQPDMALTGKYLPALYVYNYYKLLFTDGVDGFAISFSSYGSVSGDGHSFVSLKNIIKYIDTYKSTSIAAEYLDIFGVSKWEEIIPLYRTDKLSLRKLAETELSESDPDGIKGSYVYWDFSGAGGASQGWQAGEYCLFVGTGAAGSDRVPALVCQFDGRADEYDEFMGIYYVYQYPENLSLTPWLTFDFSAVCTDGFEDRLEVVIIIGEGTERIEGRTVVNSGERVKLTFDISSFSAKKSAKYIKICIRGEGSGLENAALELFSITGHSQSYDSLSLASAIASERQKASENDPTPKSNNIFWISTIGGAAFISVISIYLLGKNARGKTDKESGER